ncbi:MAG: hypothetical protein AAGA85_01145 [Bacteroidota bacterium]
MKNYLIFLFCIQVLVGQAQSIKVFKRGADHPAAAANSDEPQGDAYLLEDWSKGTINSETGTFDSLLLRYNIVSDIVDYQRGTYTLSFNQGALNAFELETEQGTRVFKYMKIDQVKKKSRVGFYEVISLGSDNPSLYIKHKKVLHDADIGAYKIQEQPEYYYEATLYILEDGELMKSRLTKKLCDNNLGKSKDEVEARLQKFGISLSN